MLSRQDALASAPELIEEFGSEETWFWLAGKELKEKERGLHDFDMDGNLLSLTEEKNPDQKVCVYPGKSQLSLGIYSNNNAAGLWRFDLNAIYAPTQAAPVVIGMLKPSTSLVAKAIRADEARELLIHATEELKGLEPSNTKNLARLIRALEISE